MFTCLTHIWNRIIYQPGSPNTYAQKAIQASYFDALVFAQSGAIRPAPLVRGGDTEHGQSASVTVAHDPDTVREVQEKGNRALLSILQGARARIRPACPHMFRIPTRVLIILSCAKTHASRRAHGLAARLVRHGR